MESSNLWQFDLYVVDETPRAKLAYSNLMKILDRAHKRSKINVIDLLKNPEQAVKNQILANPTIIREFPLPKVTLIGTLTDTDCVLSKLGLRD